MQKSELFVVSEDSAFAPGRTCRICFEEESDDAETANPLIAPCACKGSQEWVHRRCLHACQLAGYATARRESCGVCLERYSHQLHVPAPPELQVGDLLLASPELTGTFKSAVILMCEFGRRILGLVVSAECARPPVFPDLPKTRHYIGGPVCGGRFGVVQYLVCIVSSSAPSNDDASTEFSRLILGPRPPAVDPHAHSALYPGADSAARGAMRPDHAGERGDVEEEAGEARDAGEAGLTFAQARSEGVSTLQQHIGRGDAVRGGATGGGEGGGEGGRFLRMHHEWKMEEESRAAETARRASEAPDTVQVLVFKGYCAWGDQQLKDEFARGMWGYTAGGVADLFSHNPEAAVTVVGSAEDRRWDGGGGGGRGGGRVVVGGSHDPPTSTLLLVERVLNALRNRHGEVWGQASEGLVGGAQGGGAQGGGQHIDGGCMWDRLRLQPQRVTWPHDTNSDIQILQQQ
jgi:putative AlgH/UPF0301 family transcriptional regulator